MPAVSWVVEEINLGHISLMGATEDAEGLDRRNKKNLNIDRKMSVML